MNKGSKNLTGIQQLQRNEIRKHLFEGHFSHLETTPLPIADPIMPTQMRLTLDDVEPHDRNPRRVINPRYGEIKESIREQQGLTNFLTVTRRPGEKKYRINAGGNTRLSILKELYAETGDPVFNLIHCLFIPWDSEAKVLAAHLIENEMRGDMTLIDKAYALQALRMDMEQSAGSPLSDKAFEKALKLNGLPISIRNLSRLKYLIKLDQYIPTVLRVRTGITYRKLDAIRTIEQAYLDYCEDNFAQQMPSLFADVMARHDSEQFNLEAVRNDLDQQLSDFLNISAKQIKQQIDALLWQRSKSGVSDGIDEEIDLFQSSVTANSSKSDSAREGEVLVASKDPSTDDPLGQNVATQTELPDAFIHQGAPKLRMPEIHSRRFDSTESLHEFGVNNFKLASEIIKQAGMQNVVFHRPTGMGFELQLSETIQRGSLEWKIERVLLAISDLNNIQLINISIFNLIIKLMINCRNIKQFSSRNE